MYILLYYIILSKFTYHLPPFTFLSLFLNVQSGGRYLKTPTTTYHLFTRYPYFARYFYLPPPTTTYHLFKSYQHVQ